MPFVLRLSRFLFAVCALLLACTVPHPQAQSSTPLPLKTDDYVILREALNNFAARHKTLTLHIVRFTKLQGPVSCPDEANVSMQLRSAFNDLRRQKFLTFVIEPKLDLSIEYELVDEFTQEETVEKLEQMMRGQVAQVQVSAPGMSDDGQVAIVSIADLWFRGKFGGFEYKVLRKKDNSWIADTKMLCKWLLHEDKHTDG